MFAKVNSGDPSAYQVCLPLVSIVVTTFNRPVLLKEAVASCLAQTYPRVEILVVDDGSDPRNRAEAERLVEDLQAQRVRYIYKGNAGPSSARNAGIAESSGKYVKFLDDDDTLEPDAIWHFVFALESTGADLAIGGRRYLSPEGIKWDVNYVPEPGLVHRALKKFFRLQIKPQQGLWCFSRAVFGSGTNWNEELKAREDTDLLARLLVRGASVVGAPAAILNHRYHPGERRSQDQFSTQNYPEIHRSNERLLELLIETGQIKEFGYDFAASLARTAVRLWPIDHDRSVETYRLALRAHPKPPLVLDSVGRVTRAVAGLSWGIGGLHFTARLFSIYSRASRAVAARR